MYKPHTQTTLYHCVQNGQRLLMSNDSASDVISHPFGKTDMILYQEPEVMPDHFGAFVEQPQQLDDYSQQSLCDYKVAYKDTNKPLAPLEESYPTHPPVSPQTDVEKAYEAIQVQRRLDDLNLENNESAKMKSIMLKFNSLRAT